MFCCQMLYKISTTCGQSYKASTIVIYDTRVVPDLKILNSRVVNYERKLFIRLPLVTGLVVANQIASFQLGIAMPL